ncbi:four-carbon acid sugar kinase family protein [Winogradskyella sp. R77965]|uniref:four-carbon acid sugar kinase family protein n=1 Tax=Winogradskyella sp. R77965 TaxID=3093872 RepID=UPI0037DC0104
MKLNDKIAESIAKGNAKNGSKAVSEFLAKNPRTFVILDDDPTGTQTIQDVSVVTDWNKDTLEHEIKNSPVFFILTNSRSLQSSEAKSLAHSIGLLLAELAKECNKQLVVISRSDSTLRGHYPNEVESLIDGLGWQNTKHVLIPAFFQGGRYTFEDIHYVQDNNQFIPAGETPFAKDATFGYSNSNLKDYIEEKYVGLVKRNHVLSVSLDTLRNTTVQTIKKGLTDTVSKHIIVNATSNSDLETFALAALDQENNYLFRTAASFVNAITGIASKPLLSKQTIFKEEDKGGALIVIGSYVPKTTAQLKHLKKKNSKAIFIKLKVGKLLSDTSKDYLKSITTIINNRLERNREVILYTSRKVYVGDSKKESLDIVNKVSEGLIHLVRSISIRPKYILTKGGITSSDICVKSLGVKKALVIGQVLKGVPIWRLDKTSKFPDLPYIVFPGNVGGEEDLYKLINSLE